jgi:peptide/nickel transport system permease protein
MTESVIQADNSGLSSQQDSVGSSSQQDWLRALYRFRQSWLSVVGLTIVLFLFTMALIGPYIVPHADDVLGAINPGARLRPPSTEYWFGTNELGQDVFSLVVAGARISLFAGFAVVILGSLIGIVLGALAGYFGGWLDECVMRLTDLKLTLPGLILAMAVAAALGPSLFNTIFAIALSWWSGYARLVRGEVIAKKEELFVQAAQALGAGTWRILRRHILPNIASPVVIKMSLDMGFAILSVASLGFIGIGVKPPAPEWGSLLSTARAYMPDFWWTAIFPGFAIFFAVFGFNLLGDGIRDLLDPKARR